MVTPVQQRPLGSQGLQASSLGYGAMGLTAFYGPPSEDDSSIGNVNIALLISILVRSILLSFFVIRQKFVIIYFCQLLLSVALR